LWAKRGQAEPLCIHINTDTSFHIDMKPASMVL
jgi:hypothetical protein